MHGLNVCVNKCGMLKTLSSKTHEDCDEESGPSGRTIEETDAEEEVVPDDYTQNQVE